MDFSDKQLDILKAAGELFGKKGFDGTSVRDIAKEADVNVAMINYYFRSKEGLMDDLFTYYIEQFKIDENTLVTNQSAIAMMDSLIKNYIGIMNSNIAVYQMLAIEGGMKKRLLASNSYKDLKEHNLQVVTAIIEKGEESGEFIKGHHPLLIHSTIMGTFMNFQMNRAYIKTKLNISSDKEYNQYMGTVLVKHVQTTIKALLTYEN